MKVRGKQVMRNIFFMYLAQMVQMLLSIVMSVYVPMIVGLKEFSFWQLFIFYSSYVGMLHLGLNDGIYLKYGGSKLDDKEKISISNQLWFSMAFQVIILLVLFIVLVCNAASKERVSVFGFVFLYAIINNIFNFCGSTFQAINKIKLYSITVIADRLFVIVSIVTLTLLGEPHFKVLIICYIIGKSIAALILLIRGKDIFLRNLCNLLQVIHEMFSNIKTGCNLMLANIASTFIIGVGRLFVDLNYPIEVFGIVSFAFTMTGFVLALISQVGNAVFPVLKGKSTNMLRNIYPCVNLLLSDILPLCYLCLPLLFWFINKFLIQYKGSLEYFVYIMPMCIFEAKNAMLYNTYMKMLRKERFLLVINIISVIVSLLLSLFTIYVIHSLPLLIVGLVVSVILKAQLLHFYLCREMNVSLSKHLFTPDLLLSVIFTMIYVQCESLSAISMYIAAVLFAFLFIRYKNIKHSLKEIFYIQNI